MKSDEVPKHPGGVMFFHLAQFWLNFVQCLTAGIPPLRIFTLVE